MHSVISKPTTVAQTYFRNCFIAKMSICGKGSKKNYQFQMFSFLFKYKVKKSVWHPRHKKKTF